MAGLFNSIIKTVYDAIANNTDSQIDWSWNGTEIEGRGDDIFYIISADSVSFDSECYQTSTCKYRKISATLKCDIFAPCDTQPLELCNCFENDICVQLFKSSLSVSEINHSAAKINPDYDRMELSSKVTVQSLYIYE